MTNAPDDLAVTGPDFFQKPLNTMLVTPIGGTQQPLAAWMATPNSTNGYRQNGRVILTVGPFSQPQGQNTAAIFIGPGAGAEFPLNEPDGYGVIAIGTNALSVFTAHSSENTSIGTWSCANLVTGSLVTIVGMHGLGAATDATGVTGFGNDAFRDSFPGGYAVAVGQHAMAHGAPGTGSIAIGSQAMRGCSASLILGGTVTTGNQITVNLAASGSSPDGLTGLPFSFVYTVQAGDTLTTIAAAIALAVINAQLSGPYYIIGCISEGNPDNTATVSFQWPGTESVGWALTLTGSSNGTETVTVQNGSVASSSVSMGNSSMIGLGLATVQANSFYGDSTGTKLRTGNFNSAFGYQAGQNITTASNNVIIGATAGKAITTGAGNTILGFLTGTNITTGANNTVIGGGVAGTLITGSGNIYVGGGISLDAGSAGESHTFRLGDNATNLMRATGVNTATPAFFLDWIPNSTSYANDSAAATGGVAVGQIYRNGSVLQCRIS